MLNAYGIDSEFLNTKLIKKNAKIILEETDTKTTYTTDAKTFKEKGVYYHFKDSRADHNTQLFLPLSLWEKKIEGQSTLIWPVHNCLLH